MKHLSFVALVLIISHLHVNAQQGLNACDGKKGISTNPANPINPEAITTNDSTKLNSFDWMAPEYEINSTLYPNAIVSSPFHTDDNMMVNHLLDNKDRKWTDGWELIKYDMGTPNQATDIVYLILYNKYLSKLRVFLMGDPQKASYSGAQVKISFQPTSAGNYVSSALSQTSKLYPLDEFYEDDKKITAVSGYGNYLKNWFYADFFMGYDPCTCLWESKLLVEVLYLTEADIQITGLINGTLADIDDKVGFVEEQGFSTEKLISTGEKAIKSYENIDKFRSEQLKAISNKPEWHPPLSPPSVAAEKAQKLDFFQNALKNSGFLRAGLAAAPYVAGALELMDLFSGGGSSQPQQVTLTPMSLNAEVKLGGTITTNDRYKDITLHTPGSKNAETKNRQDYPMYNEIMGVFNLEKTPVIKYSSYSYQTSTTGSCHNYPVGITEMEFIVDEVKYLYNPASSLSIQEIFGSIVLYRGNGLDPVITDPVPIGQLAATPISFGSINVPGANWQRIIGLGNNLPLTQKAEIIFYLNLQRPDFNTNDQSQNVLIKMKFDAVLEDNYNPISTELEDIAYMEVPCPEGGVMNIPVPRVFVNNKRVLRGIGQSMWSALAYIGGSNSYNGYMDFKKDKLVIQQNLGTQFFNLSTSQIANLQGSNLFVNLQNGVDYNAHYFLADEIIGGSDNLNLRSINGRIRHSSQVEITNFCNSGIYKVDERKAEARLESPENGEMDTEMEENSFMLYPNPTSDYVNVRFDLDQESKVQLTLRDATGKVMLDFQPDDIFSAGQHTLRLNTAEYAKGLYLFTFTADGEEQTQRLIIE